MLCRRRRPISPLVQILFTFGFTMPERLEMEELACGNFDIDIHLIHPIIVVTGFVKQLTVLDNGPRKQIRSCRRRLSKSVF